MVSFFVYDIDSGLQVSDYFNTFKQAEKECKKISKKQKGIFGISVAICEVRYSNGKLQEI